MKEDIDRLIKGGYTVLFKYNKPSGFKKFIGYTEEYMCQIMIGLFIKAEGYGDSLEEALDYALIDL